MTMILIKDKTITQFKITANAVQKSNRIIFF